MQLPPLAIQVGVQREEAAQVAQAVQGEAAQAAQAAKAAQAARVAQAALGVVVARGAVQGLVPLALVL